MPMTSAQFAATMKPHTEKMFEKYLVQNNSFLARFMSNGRKFDKASNTTFSWTDLQLSPKTWTVGGSTVTKATLDGGGATVTVGSTTGLKAGYILGVKTSAGSRKPYQLLVKTVASGTTITVDVYGGTSSDLTSGTILTFVSYPIKENNKDFEDKSAELPDKFSNYTQIFEASYGMSKTSLVGIETFNDVNKVSYLMEQAWLEIERQLTAQAWFGIGKERDGTFNGSFKGVDTLLSEYSGNVISESGAITKTMVQNAIASIVARGGKGNTLVCNVAVARKIVGFNTAGNNPVITQESRVVGNVAMSFLSDIPMSGGLYYDIIIDETLYDDELFILDGTKVGLVPMQGRELTTDDGTANGQDGITMIVRGEYTLAMRGIKNANAKVKGFTLS